MSQLAGTVRVAEVSERWGLGGTEQAIEVRSGLLSRMGFDVTAIGVEGGGARLDRLAAAGVPTSDCAGDWAGSGRLCAPMVRTSSTIREEPRSASSSIASRTRRAPCRFRR